MTLGSREKLMMGVIAVLVVVLIVVLLFFVVPNGLTGHRADLKIMSWDHSERQRFVELQGYLTDVTFRVNVTNEGDAVGNATIRCVVAAGNGTYYGTRVISLSPGEVQTYTVVVTCLGREEPTYLECALVRF